MFCFKGRINRDLKRPSLPKLPYPKSQFQSKIEALLFERGVFGQSFNFCSRRPAEIMKTDSFQSFINYFLQSLSSKEFQFKALFNDILKPGCYDSSKTTLVGLLVCLL